jgi:hypothetical protein
LSIHTLALADMDRLCAPVAEVPALRAAIRTTMDMVLPFVLMIMVRLLYSYGICSLLMSMKAFDHQQKQMLPVVVLGFGRPEPKRSGSTTKLAARDGDAVMFAFWIFVLVGERYGRWHKRFESIDSNQTESHISNSSEVKSEKVEFPYVAVLSRMAS